VATKRMKEISNLTGDELTRKIAEIESELFQTRIQKTTGQLADTAKTWRLRKEIARMKTVQTQQAAKKSAPAAARK
jgi:large subunit ribosomal protein L29